MKKRILSWTNIAKTLDVYFPKGTFTNWEKRLVFLMD